jgi:predicted HTH transcriptional regulator
LQFDGVSKADLASWVPDHVADRLFNFTDPPIRFELSVVQFDQKSFVVLEVAEFDMVPVICKRSYPGVLVEGAIFVRPRRNPESVAVPTLADMRDLVELASEKLARRMIAQAERLGLTSATPIPVDDELYRSEAPDLLA